MAEAAATRGLLGRAAPVADDPCPGLAPADTPEATAEEPLGGSYTQEARSE